MAWPIQDPKVTAVHSTYLRSRQTEDFFLYRKSQNRLFLGTLSVERTISHVIGRKWYSAARDYIRSRPTVNSFSADFLSGEDLCANRRHARVGSSDEFIFTRVDKRIRKFILK